MFWADRITEEIKAKFVDKIATGMPLILRDEKTLSGAPHFGSMRSMAIHSLLSEILDEKSIANTYFYEINDFDPMDDIPSYLDRTIYEEHLGKPLYAVPAPDGKAVNYAEYFAASYIKVLDELEMRPEYYRLSELYRSGRMNDAITTALNKAESIREIYKRVSGGSREAGWLPINIICEQCGKMSTTRASDFDGETVFYECAESSVQWTKGCAYTGLVSPFDGRGKLLWKVDWAAKFKVVGVDVEAAGKDHYTKGGSRHVANAISDEVYDYPHPFDIPHEFFLIGGKKMSSSKGQGISATDAAELMSPQIFRLALLGRDYNKQVEFNPNGDTIPVLFDEYDKLAEFYFAQRGDDYAREFELIHSPAERAVLKDRFRPRFSQVAFLSQMPHIDVQKEAQLMKGAPLTELDKAELEERLRYAKVWLEKYAAEEFKFVLHVDEAPLEAKSLSADQKTALAKVLGYIKAQQTLEGQAMHTALHEIRKESGLEPKDFFAALYTVFLGKPYGPKAGWFLSVLDKDFLERRLGEVVG
jgi:lysyl-tRNA synthetase class 1